MLKFDFNFLWTIINLIIFFVLMKVFLFKPIKKVIDARKELINKQFQDADDINAQAEELKQQYEQKLVDADDEKKRIIGEARDSAKVEYNKILDRAQADADRLKAEAEKQIVADTQSAKRAAKEQIASLAMEAAEKVVGANVNAQTDSDMFDEFLNESSDEQ